MRLCKMIELFSLSGIDFKINSKVVMLGRVKQLGERLYLPGYLDVERTSCRIRRLLLFEIELSHFFFNSFEWKRWKMRLARELKKKINGTSDQEIGGNKKAASFVYIFCLLDYRNAFLGRKKRWYGFFHISWGSMPWLMKSLIKYIGRQNEGDIAKKDYTY